jgi:hypothetical protein
MRSNEKEISHGQGVVANTVVIIRSGPVGFNRLVSAKGEFPIISQIESSDSPMKVTTYAAAGMPVVA